MHAYESAQASAAAGTVSDRVSLDALVCVAARRLVLGVDVAAAKFLSGQPIDDHVREQEILESMAGRLKQAELPHALGMRFFRDQIEANKVIQRGLHRYWDEHPEEFPVRHRHLKAELRPQLDIADWHMLLVLIRMEKIPPTRRSHIDGLFDRKLRTSPVLRQLAELRRDAADIALQYLHKALLSSRVIDETRQYIRAKAGPPLASAFPGYDQRKPFMVMMNTKTAVPAGRSLDAITRPSTTPAYYLGRPASAWIAAFRRDSLRTKAMA